MWLTACGSAFASNWDDGGTGDSWIDPLNWSGDVLPVAGEVTYIDNSDTAVLYSGDTGVTGQFRMRGTADLTVEGTLTTDNLTKLADLAGSDNIVTIDGGTWEVQNYLYAGQVGSVSITVTNGGVLDQNTSGYGLLISSGGTLDLVDGTVYTTRLRGDAGGLIQIAAGTQIISAGNDTSEINGLVASGILVSTDTDPNNTILVTYADSVTTVEIGPRGPASGWTGGGVDDDWTDYDNWGGSLLPTSANAITLNESDTAVINSGDTGETGYFYVAGTGGGTASLTVEGTLTTTGLAYAQPPAGSASIATIDGGTWTVTSRSYWENDATLIVNNGGTFNVNATDYGFRVFNGAVLELNDGTVNCGKLRVETGSWIEMGVNGTIVVDGNESVAIQAYVDADPATIFPTDPLNSISVELVDGDTVVKVVLPATPQVAFVDFGAQYTADNASIASTATPVGPTTGDYDFDGNDDDEGSSVAFGTVWSPSNHGGWTTPAGKSGPNLLHGKLLANLDSSEDPTGGWQYDRTTQWAGSDFLVQLSASSTGDYTANRSLASVFYYDKADFIKGQSAVADLAFDHSSEINIGFAMAAGIEGRALVCDGTQWYISADSVVGGATLTISPATSDFYAFDPATILMFNSVTPGTPVSGSTFTDITAMGLHMQHANYAATGGNKYQFFNSFSATVPGAEPTSLSNWAASYGLYDEDQAVLEAADPDGDGLDNLTEWALDGNPTVSDAATVLQLGMDGSELSLTYKRRLNAAAYGNLTYSPETVTELGGTWTGTGVTEETSIISVEFEQVTSSVPVDVAKRFMHLGIDADTSVLGPEIDEAAYGIPEALTTPTINGTIAGGEWDDAYHMLLDASIADGFGSVSYQTPTAADLSVDCYLKWDATFLYVAFKVTDDIRVFGTAHWPNDGLVLAINPSFAGTVATTDCVHNEMFHTSGGTADLASIWNAALAPTNASYASTEQVDGYTYEIRYLWSDLGVTPVAGQIHGMVIQVNDKDVNTPDSGAIDESGTGTILVDGGAVGTASSYRPVMLIDSL